MKITPVWVRNGSPDIDDLLRRVRLRRARRAAGAAIVAIALTGAVIVPLALWASSRDTSLESPDQQLGYGDRDPSAGWKRCGYRPARRGLGIGVRRSRALDPVTDRVVASVPTPGTGYQSSRTTGFGSIWVTTDEAVLRIDVASSRVVATIRLGGLSDGPSDRSRGGVGDGLRA